MKILKNRKTYKNPVKYVFLGFTFVVSYVFFGNFLIIFENRKWAQPPKGGAGWNFIDFPLKIHFPKILKNLKTSKNPGKYVFLGFTFVVSYEFTTPCMQNH